jgi:hypothetical protein
MAVAIGFILHAVHGADETVWWRATDYAVDEATGRTYNQWHAWREAFEWIALRKGLRSANECTPYAIGGEEHPERLKAEYKTGRTPEQSFEEMGCDCEVFERVWMKRLRILAKEQHIAINPRDDEAFEEWLWLEYFTENKPPDEAISAVADSGYMKGKP